MALMEEDTLGELFRDRLRRSVIHFADFTSLLCRVAVVPIELLRIGFPIPSLLEVENLLHLLHQRNHGRFALCFSNPFLFAFCF